MNSMPQSTKATSNYKPHFITTVFLLVAVFVCQFYYFKYELQKKESLLKTTFKSLEKSNRIIKDYNGSIFYEFKDDLKEPAYGSVAKVWDSGITISQETVLATDSLLKASIKVEKMSLTERKKIIQYIDSAYQKLVMTFPVKVRKEIIELKSGIPFFDEVLPKKNDTIEKIWLKGNDAEWKGFLVKMNNDILSFGNFANRFFNEQSSRDWWRNSDYRPLTFTNNAVYKPGQILELITGIGAFAKDISLKVYIDGKQIELNGEDYLNYKRVITTNDPGSIEIKLEFIHPLTKTNQEVIQEVVYDVLKP